MLFYTLFLIIRRFLVKRFLEQFVESVKRKKFSTPTGIVLVIVHYAINVSIFFSERPPMYIRDKSLSGNEWKRKWTQKEFNRKKAEIKK